MAVTAGIPEITPREFKARLDRGDNLFILDVRESHEYQICNLKGHLIPLGICRSASANLTARARSWRIAGAASARPTPSSFCRRRDSARSGI